MAPLIPITSKDKLEIGSEVALRVPSGNWFRAKVSELGDDGPVLHLLDYPKSDPRIPTWDDVASRGGTELWPPEAMPASHKRSVVRRGRPSGFGTTVESGSSKQSESRVK